MKRIICVGLVVMLIFAATVVSSAAGNIDDSVWRVTLFDGSYHEIVLKNGSYTDKMYGNGTDKSGTYKRNGNLVTLSDGNKWSISGDWMYHLNSAVSNVDLSVLARDGILSKVADNKAFMVEFIETDYAEGIYREYVKMLGKWELFIEQPYSRSGELILVGPYHQKRIAYDSSTKKLYPQVAVRMKNWVTVSVAGEQLSFDTEPQIINSRVMVPMRRIFEALGAEVSWDAATKTVTGKYGSTDIKLPIGSNIAYIGKEEITLDSPACIVNGRTLVPVRFVAESMGSNVQWEQSSKSVSISKANPAFKYSDKIKDFLNLYADYDMIGIESDSWGNVNIPSDYEGFAYIWGGASISYENHIYIGTIDQYEPNVVKYGFTPDNPELFDKSKTKEYRQGDLVCYSANVVMIIYIDGWGYYDHIVDILYLDEEDSAQREAKDIALDLEMSADLEYSKDKKTAFIRIEAEADADVTVNGNSIKMSSTYYDEAWGEYREDKFGFDHGEYVYEFNQEGSKEFTIKGIKDKKSKTIKLTAKYENKGPTLTIDDLPAETHKREIYLYGEVKGDEDYDTGLKVTVNGERVYLDYSHGTWRSEYAYKLKEGDNTFTIVATNALGVSTTETRTVKLVVNPPILEIETESAETHEEEQIIGGTVSDVEGYINDITVTVNGEKAYLNHSSGYWRTEYAVRLKEGANTFTVVASNSFGKSTTKTVTITYIPE
jgi:hypothetical protein